MAKSSNIAVLHVLRGRDDEITKRGRLHVSLAFVSGISMPIVPYKTVPVSLDLNARLARCKKLYLSSFVDFTSRLRDLELDGQSPDSFPIPKVSGNQSLSKSEQRRKVAELARGVELEDFGADQTVASNLFREILKAPGQEYRDTIGFRRVFAALYELRDVISMLHVVTDLVGIPWDWIYDNGTDTFLCDLFGVGVSELADDGLSLTVQHAAEIANAVATRGELGTFLFCGNSYDTIEESGWPTFPRMANSIQSMSAEVSEIAPRASIQTRINVDRNDLWDCFETMSDELQLIYLSGHMDRWGFVCTKGDPFTSVDLRDALDEGSSSRRFRRHPIVILNGCNSGSSGVAPSRFLIEQEANLETDFTNTLAGVFLRKGAAACIVTGDELRFDKADRFSKHLVKQLLKKGTTVGQALHRTRTELLEEQYAYEWYSYHLLGDPTASLM